MILNLNTKAMSTGASLVHIVTTKKTIFGKPATGQEEKMSAHPSGHQDHSPLQAEVHSLIEWVHDELEPIISLVVLKTHAAGFERMAE